MYVLRGRPRAERGQLRPTKRFRIACSQSVGLSGVKLVRVALLDADGFDNDSGQKGLGG